MVSERWVPSHRDCSSMGRQARRGQCVEVEREGSETVLRRKHIMTGTVDGLIADEVAYAIAHEDDPLPADVKVTRPNKGTVLSVRLSDDEFRMLSRRAESDGLPLSTEGRHLIVTGLRTDMKETMVEAIRENLAPHLLVTV